MLELLQAIQPWHWLALGIVLLAIEVSLSTEILLGIGIGALLVAIMLWVVPLGWQMQLVWFAVYSVIATLIYWKYFRAKMQRTEAPLLNNKTAQLVGKKVPLFEPIVNGSGKVQIADALWRVKANQDAAKDTVVTIVGAEGMTLVVEITH